MYGATWCVWGTLWGGISCGADGLAFFARARVVVQHLTLIRAAIQSKLSRVVASDGASANVEAAVALDNAVKSVVSNAHSKTIERCLKSGLRREFPENRCVGGGWGGHG